MKTATMFLIAASAAACALAGTGDAVTKAAADASKIPEAAAAIGSASAPAFAADVMDAISSMPKSPAAKVRKLADASAQFVKVAEDGALADMIVALVSNVPFEALPEWTRLTASPVQTKTKGLAEPSYQALVNDVVKKIGDLKDFSIDDKTVITTFAMKLLARGSDPSAETAPLRGALAAVPEAYRKQVAAALPATLAGNYAAILGDTRVIVLPAEEAAPAPQAAADADLLLPAGAEAIPLKGTPPTPPTPPKPPKPPVVPPVYAEQF